MTFTPSEHVRRHLDGDLIGWLTTVSAAGRPSPRPVWFHWDGQRCVVYSQPDAAKLRHLAANDRVSLHFDADEHGGDIVVIAGRAGVLPDAPPADGWPGLLDRYAGLLDTIGMTARYFSDTYTVALEIRPERAWTID